MLRFTACSCLCKGLMTGREGKGREVLSATNLIFRYHSRKTYRLDMRQISNIQEEAHLLAEGFASFCFAFLSFFFPVLCFRNRFRKINRKKEEPPPFSPKTIGLYIRMWLVGILKRAILIDATIYLPVNNAYLLIAKCTLLSY